MPGCLRPTSASPIRTCAPPGARGAMRPTSVSVRLDALSQEDPASTRGLLRPGGQFPRSYHLSSGRGAISRSGARRLRMERGYGEHQRTAVRIGVACLMPDHFHAIVSPRDKSIIRWMNDFKSCTTRLSRDHRPQRFLWHRSFYDRLLPDAAEFEAAVGYIARNPSAAGLVEDDADWPWLGTWVE